MTGKSELVGLSKEWIAKLPVGKIFSPPDIYQFLESNYPEKVSARGSARNEPRYWNDARWAIKETHLEGFLAHEAHGVWRRISRPIDNITF
jgi:hypothetical protein